MARFFKAAVTASGIVAINLSLIYGKQAFFLKVTMLVSHEENLVKSNQ
jgi:hypothetical protein